MGNQLSLVNETNLTCKIYLHNLFTDVFSTSLLVDVSIVVYCPLFLAYNMSESGTRSGSFLEDDRPLFNNGFCKVDFSTLRKIDRLTHRRSNQAKRNNVCSNIYYFNSFKNLLKIHIYYKYHQFTQNSYIASPWSSDHPSWSRRGMVAVKIVLQTNLYYTSNLWKFAKPSKFNLNPKRVCHINFRFSFYVAATKFSAK